MSRLMGAILGVLSLLGIGVGLAMQPAVSEDSDRANSEPSGPPGGVRFITVDVFIDSGDTPLAAYQIDLKATSDGGRVLLAGIEGGEHAAFATPAFYDARALHATISAWTRRFGAVFFLTRTRLAEAQVAATDHVNRPTEGSNVSTHVFYCPRHLSDRSRRTRDRYWPAAERY